MDWITSHIAIGDLDDLVDVDRLRTNGVSALLGLNAFPSRNPVPGLRWRHAPLQDGSGNPPAAVATAVAVLDELVATDRVLVYCSEGVSRSPFVVACHLARARGVPFHAALGDIKRHRARVNVDSHLVALQEELWPRLGAVVGADGKAHEWGRPA